MNSRELEEFEKRKSRDLVRSVARLYFVKSGLYTPKKIKCHC